MDILAVMEQFGVPVAMTIAFGFFIWRQNKFIQETLMNEWKNMIDTTISGGNIFTAITVAGTLFFTTGTYSTKIENIEAEQVKTVKKVEKNENNIVDLKIGVAKIETQLDDRFDKLEEILMDLE